MSLVRHRGNQMPVDLESVEWFKENVNDKESIYYWRFKR